MDSGGVDDMFSSLGEKLGWFQFEDIDSALKFLNSKSAKKKKDNKPKKNSTSTKKNIQKPDSVGRSSTTREKSACTSPSTTNVTDLKNIFTGNFLLERDCEKINSAIVNTSAVVKEQTGKENAQPLLEKYNLSLSSSSSSIIQVKENSFDVNPNISQHLSNTFSDDSVASITSGICKKIQFNSDESSLFDSKLEQSASSRSNVGDSFEGKLSLENTASVLSTSSDSNNQSITSNQFNTGNKLGTDIGKIKIEDEYVDVSDDDDDDDDLESFLQKMLTPHKTSVGDSTNKQSGLSKIEHQKMLDSYSDLSSDKENNEDIFNETMPVTNHKRYDGTERKTNACTSTVKEIPKQSQKWVLQAEHSIDNLSSQSESCNSSSDDDDSDFEAFLEKMKKPVKETPHWLPESMKEFIVSSSDESSDEGEESLSLYHRIRISPETDKFSLFGTSLSYAKKSSTHEKGNLNDDKDKIGFPFLTPKVKPFTEIKKPSINFPQTEIKKAPEIKPRSRFLEVTPKGTSTSELKKHIQTCPNLKSSELPLKIRSNQPAENYASFLKSLSIGAATNLVDPSARKYINHFKQYQVELVSKLFKIYNDTVFDGRFPVDFSIRWNKRLLTTAGHCILKSKYTNNRKECQRNAEICLATKVCDTPERVRDTLIHEMCHAAVWMFNGSRENHGRLWKAWARKANYVHPYLPVIKRCHSYNIATKYTYRCVQCGYSFGRHSKSLDTAKKVCGYCKGQFEVLLSNTSSCTTISTPARALSKFAMFVKEHYGTVKKHEKCSHKDVMEKLSAQFRQAQI